jgi:SAM-dependent methyltransferase
MADETLKLAHRVLGALGYNDASIRTEYPVWLGAARGTQLADMVAFGRPEPTDMSTATITVAQLAAEEAYRLAQALASPYMLLVGKTGLNLWVAEPTGPRIWRENFELTDAAKYAEWLKPTAALRSKVGLRQLPLFDIPVNLLANARDSGVDRLGPIVSEALKEANNALGGKASKANTHRRYEIHQKAAQLVISSLVSLVLRDRNNWRDESASSLLAHASNQFPAIYGWLPGSSEREKEVLSRLIEGLGRGIDYASLDPVILSQVYGEALVTDDDRQKLGIHYTPPRLANKILEYMPVELIEPEGRHVLDPACGSGTLLVAAHDRLRELQPDNWNLDQRHSDLAVRLHGIDIDPFAVEIAENALFLHASPAGNGWQILQEDTLEIDPKTVDASIIVTNPPWRYTSSEGTRHQKASDFLAWCIVALRPGGLLGIILPQTWLSANYSADLREDVQTSIDIFEIWRLPVTLFESSHQASCVLIGRKRDGFGGKGSRIVREVHSQSLDPFLRTGIPQALYVVKNTAEDLWKAVDIPEPNVECQSLDSLAVIRSGPQPKADIPERSSGVLFLNHFKDVKPYAEISENVLMMLHFPGDFQTGRGQVIIDKKKILVSAARTGADPWPLRVAVDSIGVAFRNSMRGVAPIDQTDDVLLYALNIIIGSGFAAVFAASYGIDRNVPARVLHELPIPTNRHSIEILSEFGIVAARLATMGETEALQRTLGEAEPEVWAAYGYSEDDRATLTRRLAGEVAPEGKPRYTARQDGAPEAGFGFRRFGSVLEAEDSHLKLWVNGITPSDGMVVRLPDHMSGWLVRPGATFDAFGVNNSADLT